MNLNEIKNDLEQLLYKTGEIVKKGYEDKNKDVKLKRDANDEVTKYDIEANNEILKYLQENYPDISIISEEAPKISKESEFAFVIDPIDGTRNFTRNIPLFFIGIGLVKNNKTILSITYNPITKEIFHAIKNHGAFLNNKKIKVGNRNLEISDINITIIKDQKSKREVVSNIIDNVFQIKNNFCCHEELAGVACNRYDAFVSKGACAWDYCHYLLVEEAGGKVTDWNGNEFDITKDNIIASNGVIYEELLKAVK